MFARTLDTAKQCQCKVQHVLLNVNDTRLTVVVSGDTASRLTGLRFIQLAKYEYGKNDIIENSERGRISRREAAVLQIARKR